MISYDLYLTYDLYMIHIRDLYDKMIYMTYMMINQLMRVVILRYTGCIHLSLSFWQTQNPTPGAPTSAGAASGAPRVTMGGDGIIHPFILSNLSIRPMTTSMASLRSTCPIATSSGTSAQPQHNGGVTAKIGFDRSKTWDCLTLVYQAGDVGRKTLQKCLL